VTYRYNAYVEGKTREEMEEAAQAEAQEYFGMTEVYFVGADVTTERIESGDRTYGGTFSWTQSQP
jgi:hypothetical protein